MPEIRLNRYLAQCGAGSRRACDRLIAESRVHIDGKLVQEAGTRIDPSVQHVKVDGRELRAEGLLYLLFNKPVNTVCTASDPEGRRTVFDFLPENLPARVYTVGRLDRNSEGLLLLTNDGDLTHRLSHPRYEVDKEYLVRTDRDFTQVELDRIVEGVELGDERLAALEVEALGPCRYRMVLGEGRNRHIRRLCETMDVYVRALRRVRYGPIRLSTIPAGEHRMLKPHEVRDLCIACGLRRTPPGAEPADRKPNR